MNWLNLCFAFRLFDLQLKSPHAASPVSAVCAARVCGMGHT